MALKKSSLAKELEAALNSSLPGGDDFNKEKEIRKKNKKIAKMMADAINKFVKSASIDFKGWKMQPGVRVVSNPGQPVVNAPPIGGGAGATSGPGTGQTAAHAKLIPPTGKKSGKVY